MVLKVLSKSSKFWSLKLAQLGSPRFEVEVTPTQEVRVDLYVLWYFKHVLWKVLRVLWVGSVRYAWVCMGGFHGPFVHYMFMC